MVNQAPTSLIIGKVLILVLLVCSSAQAATVHVPTDFSSIQQAINFAGEGDRGSTGQAEVTGYNSNYPTFAAYIPMLTIDDVTTDKLLETLCWEGFEATNVCMFQQKSPTVRKGFCDPARS